MTDLTIYLQDEPPEDLHRFVWNELGVVPDIDSEPSRAFEDLPGYVVVVAVSSAYLAGLFGDLGRQSADGLRNVLQRLRHGEPPRREPRVVHLHVDDTDVAFIWDDAATTHSDEALQEMLRHRTDVYVEGTQLRWEPSRRRWEPETP